MVLYHSQARSHMIIREYLTIFWLSPKYQPETPFSWVKVQNVQIPEFSKLQSLDLQYAH